MKQMGFDTDLKKKNTLADALSHQQDVVESLWKIIKAYDVPNKSRKLKLLNFNDMSLWY